MACTSVMFDTAVAGSATPRMQSHAVPSVSMRIPSGGLRPIVYVEMSQKAQPFVKPLNCYCCETKKVSAVTFEPRQRLLPKTPYPPRMMA